MMKKNQNFKIIGLIVLIFLIASQSPVVFASGKKIKNIADKDLTIRQIIEKYYSDTYFDFGCISKGRYLSEDNPETEVGRILKKPRVIGLIMPLSFIW